MSSLLPLQEASPNKGPVTPRTGPTSARSSRSSIKSSAVRSSKSEHNIASITRSTSHSSVTKPRPVPSIINSARKSAISSSRSSIGLSSVLQDPESAKKIDIRSDSRVSVTPVYRPTRFRKIDEDDSLPSSPFEQYPGMEGNTRHEHNTPTASSSHFLSDEDTREDSATPRAIQTPRQNSTLHTPSTTKTKYLLDLATPAEALNVRFSPSTLSGASTPTQKNHRMENNGNFEGCLLDLDFPMLTPRSVPALSSRQVESLKAGYLSEIATLKAELAGKDAELIALRQSLRESEERNAVMEQRCNRESDRLEKIAKELHLQYSKKHETKVIALKKQLETKWASKLGQSERTIEQLNQQLEIERKEKGDLVQYWDQYLEAEEMATQILQNEGQGFECGTASGHESRREN
ncbi:central kinetochore-associated-domain-containing protein [Lipomyces tetrasporus]